MITTGILRSPDSTACKKRSLGRSIRRPPDHLSFPKIPSGRIRAMKENQGIIHRDGCHAPSAWFVANLFKSRRRLEVENLFLRH
jgi:hypothetical protein